MDKVYYMYYYFNSKILKDSEPIATTNFTLSVSEGFLIAFLINLISINLFCKTMPVWFILFIDLIIIFINYIYFNKSKRCIQIISSKPLFFSNFKISVFIVITFFLGTLSFMFWGPVFLKHLLESNCK